MEVREVKYYQGMEEDTYNGVVFYTKYGKRYTALVYIDYFNRRVYFPDQPKGYKILAGLEKETIKFLKF